MNDHRVWPLVVVLLVVPGLAYADPPRTGSEPKAGSDPAAAQVLFYEARQLMEKGKYPEACPKLEESLRLDQGLGTLFNLADCNEHVGKLASAWAGFLDVAAQSKAVNQLDREKLAKRRAAALEPRLAKLMVDVPPGAGDLTVMRDGVLIGAAAWGTAIPVDAGAHRVTVTAPGKAWETSVQATEKTTAHVAVPRDLPDAPPEQLVSAPPPVEQRPTATDGAGYVVAPTNEDRGGTQRTVGWIIAGAGVVGLGIGGGFGLSSLSKRNDSRSHCSGDACDAEGVSMRDDAIRNGNISTVAMIAGAAGVVGGLVLVLTAPKGAKERASKLRAVPTASLGGVGFQFRGSFQ